MCPELLQVFLGVDLQQLLGDHHLVVDGELLQASFHHCTTLFRGAASFEVGHHHPADVVLDS